MAVTEDAEPVSLAAHEPNQTPIPEPVAEAPAEVRAPPPADPLPEPASALCDYMDELVESLRKLVPAALDQFDETAIHQSRVATRRLKAAIELMQPALSDEHCKPFSKAGRKLRRRLGPMRDLDVMIGHLKIIQRRATHRVAAKWLELRLIEARDAAREASADEQSPARVLAQLGTWWGLRVEVLQAGDQARELLANALHLQLDAFAEQADLLAKKEPAAKQDPHELRIAGKALRYTLEMAKREGHDIPGKVGKAFKRMQDSLGNWHDFVVLTERAMRESLDQLLAHHQMDLQRQLLDFSRMTLDRARKELDQFSASWATEAPELLATIRAAVPLAKITPEPVSEPKTDPDPTGSGEPPVAPEAPLSPPATDPEAG
jgi:CHAD domain-containing protein